MNAFIAALLSFLLNGLGQLYNGQVKKGIIFIIVSFCFTMILAIGIVFLFEGFISSLNNNLNFRIIRLGIILAAFSGFILCLNGLLSIVDAYKFARKNAHKS